MHVYSYRPFGISAGTEAGEAAHVAFHIALLVTVAVGKVAIIGAHPVVVHQLLRK